MANRLFDNVQALDKQVKILAGSFAPAGTGSVTGALGRGYTVARTGVGVFTVTLADAYPSLLGGFVSLQLHAGDDKIVQFGDIDVLSAKTVVIRVWDISGAAATDIAADSNNRVNFVLVLKNSSVTP